MRDYNTLKGIPNCISSSVFCGPALCFWRRFNHAASIVRIEPHKAFFFDGAKRSQHIIFQHHVVHLVLVRLVPKVICSPSLNSTSTAFRKACWELRLRTLRQRACKSRVTAADGQLSYASRSDKEFQTRSSASNDQLITMFRLLQQMTGTGHLQRVVYQPVKSCASYSRAATGVNVNGSNFECLADGLNIVSLQRGHVSKQP